MGSCECTCFCWSGARGGLAGLAGRVLSGGPCMCVMGVLYSMWRVCSNWRRGEREGGQRPHQVTKQVASEASACRAFFLQRAKAGDPAVRDGPRATMAVTMTTIHGRVCCPSASGLCRSGCGVQIGMQRYTAQYTVQRPSTRGRWMHKYLDLIVALYQAGVRCVRV